MDSTASSAPTRKIVRGYRKEQKGSRKTKIYNHSESDIFLIPIFSTATANAREAGQLKNRKEKTIPAKDSIEVDFCEYDETRRHFLINILFRAADRDIQKVLEDFHNNDSEEEMLYLPHVLKNTSELHLWYNEVNADQIKSMRGLIMDIKAKQENLKKDVEDLIMDPKAKQEKLKEDVADLLKKTVALLEALTRVEVSCTR